MPAAPLASSSTVSFVDMQPSLSTRSTVRRVAAGSTRARVAASASASVVRTTSIVASPGASIPAPFAMPPTVHPTPSAVVRRATDVLATVSVVLMASAASSPPPALSAAAAAATPGSSRSIGSRSPMSPVEQMATSAAETPSSSATCSAVRWVSRKPSGPVQAFAPPEFSTTASTRPSDTTCRDQTTGAAWTRLVVKTAAAACSGPSLTTSATSGRPLGLRPAVTPAARNPWGAVTLTALPRFARSAVRNTLC